MTTVDSGLLYRHTGIALLRSAVWAVTRTPDGWPDPDDPQSSLGWLRQVWSDPCFAEAVRQASPTLAYRIEAICGGGETEAMLRSALGEAHLAEAVDSYAANRIIHAILFALVDDMALSDKDVNILLLASENSIANAARLGVAGQLRADLSKAPISSVDKMQWRPGRRVGNASQQGASSRDRPASEGA